MPIEAQLASGDRTDPERGKVKLGEYATFASLRRGEATALRGCDLNLNTLTVRIRAAYVERSTGKCSSACPSPEPATSRRRPDAIIPALRDHLAVFCQGRAGRARLPGVKGSPLRRCNFNKMPAWPRAVASIGMTGLHFHDLRHTGNQFAAQSGAALRDLMVRIGHDSERASMIYQREARGADQLITSAIDAHVQVEQSKDSEDGATAFPAG